MLHLDGQIHHDTHAVPMGNYVIRAGNNVIVSLSELGNYKIVDIRREPPLCQDQVRHRGQSLPVELEG